MSLIFLTILFFIVYAGLILYYRHGWIAINYKKENHEIISGENKTTISIIIAARNEEKSIAECLNSIIRQTYPSHLFETIVVDDFSTDNTAAIINSFSDKKVSLLSLKDHIGERQINSYKKKAIETAINKAIGELIAITDADCIVPPQWLQTIATFYELHSPAFIAAPVAYYGENSFLKNFQSLDFMTLQGITGASVFKKIHNMCNGANLAYPKKIFNEVNGFKDIDTIASGDDMLLMHKIYKRYPADIMFLKSANAIVKTKPEKTLRDFFNQRIRWASKADKYPDRKIIVVLAMVYFFNLYIFILGIMSFFCIKIFVLFVALLLAKTITELFLLYPVAKFFIKEKMLWWFPLCQPFHILYTIMAGGLGKFGSYKWKERKVK